MRYYKSILTTSLITGCMSLCTIDQASAAGTAVYNGQAQGATPFHENFSFKMSGSPLSSVTFYIQPIAGSVTRPISATFSAAYLTSQGLLSNGVLYLQAFGLYNNPGTQTFKNTVNFTFNFTDGSKFYYSEPVTTPGYTDPCPVINMMKTNQNRSSTSDLGYDYLLLKDYCSANAPMIIDTDGHIRWVADAKYKSISSAYPSESGNQVSASMITNGGKTVYAADGATGIFRIDVNNDLVTSVGNFGGGPYNITYVGNHNIDLGRNGTLLVGVTTATGSTTNMGSNVIETDGTKILNEWDFASIISTYMSSNSDNPAQFVYPGQDWFHQNSSFYNAADNTLVVSSRENFVMAVDYDVPSNGVRKIHWIFGDTTKKWHQFASLARLALTLSNPGLGAPPVGQHGISLDPYGNLMLMNDGQPSSLEVPIGVSFDSLAAKYKIDLSKPTATSPGTATFNWGYANFGAGTKFQSPFCGSAYDFNQAGNDSYLVDFTLQAVEDSSINNGFPGVSTIAEIQGLKGNEQLAFDLQIPEVPTNGSSGSTCGQGWNAVPVDLSALTY